LPADLKVQGFLVKNNAIHPFPFNRRAISVPDPSATAKTARGGPLPPDIFDQKQQ